MDLDITKSLIILGELVKNIKNDNSPINKIVEEEYGVSKNL